MWDVEHPDMSPEPFKSGNWFKGLMESPCNPKDIGVQRRVKFSDSFVEHTVTKDLPSSRWSVICFSLCFPLPPWSESHLFVSDSLRPGGQYSPWKSPGQNTRRKVTYLFLLQGIFPIQGSNPGLLHCRQVLYQLSHKGSPRKLEWVAYPFSSRSSWPRDRTGISFIIGRFLTNWAFREAQNEIYKPWPWNLVNWWMIGFTWKCKLLILIMEIVVLRRYWGDRNWVLKTVYSSALRGCGASSRFLLTPLGQNEIDKYLKFGIICEGQVTPSVVLIGIHSLLCFL